MLTYLEGRCPICLNNVRVWHTDHNHKTGKVTGPVCANCNIGPLAMTYHDVDLVRRLLAYLENPTADQLGVEAYAPTESGQPANIHKIWNHRGKQRIVSSAPKPF